MTSWVAARVDQQRQRQAVLVPQLAALGFNVLQVGQIGALLGDGCVQGLKEEVGGAAVAASRVLHCNLVTAWVVTLAA